MSGASQQELFVARHVSVRGRVRLQVPPLYRDFDAAREVETMLGQIRGVRTVHVNPRIGSVLLICEPDLSFDDLAQELVPRLSATFPASGPPQTYIARQSSPKLSKLRAAIGEAPAATARGLLQRGAETASRVLRQTLPNLSRTQTSAAANAVAVAPREPWHALSAAQTATYFASDPSCGLDAAEVEKRRAAHGPNLLPEPEHRSELSIFVGQFTSVPVALLAGSAVLSAATGGLFDAGAILVVVLANAVIGYVTESSAERTIRSLERIDPQPIRVRRQGALRTLQPDELVPGDVIMLRPGLVVPADGRLLSSRSLTIDESALTGESLPVEKRATVIERLEAPMAEQINMVFRSTVVTGGEGEALVVATGIATQIGQVQQLLCSVEASETPLQQQLGRLGKQLVIGSSLVCGGVFVLGLLRGQGLLQMLKTSISLAVAAVPEGLPTVAITTLALGIRRMEAHNVSVRHLSAVETLGAIQTLCMDKTGTITENRMAVQAVSFDGKLRAVAENQIAGVNAPSSLLEETTLRHLLLVCALCSEVTLEGGGPEIQLIGSPTERALVELGVGYGLDIRAERRRHPRLTILHRSEAVQLMATLHEQHDTRKKLWAIKGQPSEVLSRCSHYLNGGAIHALGAEPRDEIIAHNEAMAGRALRVLGVAFVECDEGAAEPPAELIWLGLVGIADPPRPGMRALLERFHGAGIDTLMITGDQVGTAHAVAREIGLARDGRIEMLDSVQLDRLEPELLRSLSQRAQVFARVSPAHKLRIVQALQASGRAVAMTGDGVNDGPALKAAHVGIAMGAEGTQVARDVADIVLKDDRLESLLVGVQLGRTIYDDIRKAVRFILATNLSEILVTAVEVAIGGGEVLTPMQLLWINILSDVFPELALAVQPAESDVLMRPPRASGAPMFSRRDMLVLAREGLLISAAALGARALVGRRSSPQVANTVAFMTLTSAQLLHTISARSETHSIFGPGRLAPNKYIGITVGGALGLQVIAGLFPPLRRVLGTTAVAPADWLTASLFALAPMIINELIKLTGSSKAQAELSPPMPAALVN
jgi:Ca2+-transporting ATPase